MTLPGSQRDRVLAALLQGLPWSDRPYAQLGLELGLSEDAVLASVRELSEDGVLSRLGFVVRHHEAGYRANAMVVWALADAEADRCGALLATIPWVTLAYRRRASPPDWPYNLYAMIHGKDRGEVREQIEQTARQIGLETAPRKVLFSRRRFMQRSGVYVPASEAA